MPSINPSPQVGDAGQSLNPLVKDDTKDVAELNNLYNETDKDYLDFLQKRLQDAKNQRDATQPLFNNQTYLQYYEGNQKIANTHQLEAKKNPDDVVVSAGTVEQKLDAVLSHINNLNLSPEVYAFDKNNVRISSLGHALEDIIHDTEIRDGGDGGGDEEKKLARQRELLKQGTVFVQEEWLRSFEIKKKLYKEFDGKFKQEADYYTKNLELVFEGPSRTLLYGPNVYLGDITEFYMENQPYTFVVIHQNYDVAKARYGKFENWQYVKRGAVPNTVTDASQTIFDNNWRLTEVKNNQVEIILYQDKPNDDFNILINGVPMLPIGFPLSVVSPGGQYNIAKQVFRILSDKCAYGGSFVSSGSIKEVSALIDEMLKLFILKTRKSFTPAYVNTSGRVISRVVLSPGRISMGIDAGSLQPIAGGETEGVTAGEVSVLREFQGLIDKSTVSEQFTGQPGRGTQTATEVVEVQRKAQLVLNLTIAACSFLEKKLSYLRLWNILANWFEPTDERVVEVEGAREMVKVYRRTSRDVPIEGEGFGERMVIPTEGEVPNSETIRALERKQEKETGKIIRRIYINPEGLKKAKLLWYIVINSKERESSPFYKMMFREQINDILTMVQLGSRPNVAGIEEEFSRLWNKSRDKLFMGGPNQQQVTPDMAGVSAAQGGGGQARGRTNPAGVPQAPGGMGI